MTRFDTPLPIDDALPKLTAALRAGSAAVLVAPPGAGKTTRVPLVLMDEPWARAGKVLVLEPRRLAARAAAARMAATLGEEVGGTVGLRVRFEARVSARTRIEVVTEGVFTRLVTEDPALEGIAAVLFDEFHERSLDADLGLALARDAQTGLREDLRLLPMSATLDGARVAALLGGAEVVESEGRAYPVETRHVPREAREPIERAVAEAVRMALSRDPGSVLVFLPGAAEIRRTATWLAERGVPVDVDVLSLHGALDPREQDRAVAPAPAGRRKVVLATSIAETSLTLEGVRVVIDSGLARVPRFEADVGVTRLETVRVSRAAADQRRGRAGRTAPGVCYRLWEEAATGSLEPFATPEILAADLSGLMLDLASFGVTDPSALAFLDPPPKPAVSEARALLTSLGALDADGRLTPRGDRLRRLPLPPRLARMVVDAAAYGAETRAAELAALIGERGLGGDDIDLARRREGLARDRSKRAADVRAAAGRWASLARTGAARPDAGLSDGALLALGFPDRVAKARGGGAGGAFLMANGRGVAVDAASPLARAAYLAVGEMTGRAAEARVQAAAEVTEAEIVQLFGAAIETRDEVTVEPATLALRRRAVRRLSALTLSAEPRPVEPSAATARLLARAIAEAGLARLPWSKALLQWRERVGFLHRAGEPGFPDLSDAALAASAEVWLAPALENVTSLAALQADAFSDAVQALLPWDAARRLEAEAPTHFEAPTGSRVPIDYSGDAPAVAIRVQELFGLGTHPSIAGGRIALTLELLSPAHRPVQITRDLPGFWRGSWAAVRAEMRGRYPRHPWPDDPAVALPTTRAKPRGT